jgi:thimet oligopeptidase
LFILSTSSRGIVWPFALTAKRYRELVLAPGGTKPAAELVQDFLGRPISIDAYRAKLAKDQ